MRLPKSRTPRDIESDDVESKFERLQTFFVEAMDGNLASLDESDDAFGIGEFIRDNHKRIREVQFHLFTSRKFFGECSYEGFFGDYLAKWQIWDVNRVAEISNSSGVSEAADIDCRDFFQGPLQCLAATPGPNYQVFLALLSGDAVADLYQQFGERLLQQNVRAFLQTSGKINKGIRETIINEPENFLTFNNGISAVASGVDFFEEDASLLTYISGLQIVNGGQTTASLAYAKYRDGADLSAVSVQMKLTVVDSLKDEDFVMSISKYSNTQNKVTASDFTVNSSFYRDLERWSRLLLTPSAVNSGRSTYWYFERLRGGYATELNRISDESRKKEFKIANPTAQKFGPTEVAKALSAWD